MIVEGRMQYLFDEKGRRFLDVSPLGNIAREALYGFSLDITTHCF
jgi:hypothetical protein